MAQVKVPDDVHRRMKARADERGLNYGSYIEMAVEHYEQAHYEDEQIFVYRMTDIVRRDMLSRVAVALAAMPESVKKAVHYLVKGIEEVAQKGAERC